MYEPVLSFIIPVYNDEEHIGGVIDRIRQVAGRWPHEIIVVDNGSNDRSPRIALDKVLSWHYLPDVTVAAVRNHGARRAQADILAFLDSDVYLQDRWAEAIPNVIRTLRQEISS